MSDIIDRARRNAKVIYVAVATQDEYAIAQSAFYFAHPGRGPQSSLMASTPPTETQETER